MAFGGLCSGRSHSQQQPLVMTTARAPRGAARRRPRNARGLRDACRLHDAGTRPARRRAGLAHGACVPQLGTGVRGSLVAKKTNKQKNYRFRVCWRRSGKQLARRAANAERLREKKRAGRPQAAPQSSVPGENEPVSRKQARPRALGQGVHAGRMPQPTPPSLSLTRLAGWTSSSSCCLWQARWPRRPAG